MIDGIAYAELLDGLVAAEPPITAEAEAEKPTRARRPTKKADPPPREDEELELEELELEETTPTLEAEPPAEPAMELLLEAEDAEPVSVEEAERTLLPPVRPGRRRRRSAPGAARAAGEIVARSLPERRPPTEQSRRGRRPELADEESVRAYGGAACAGAARSGPRHRAARDPRSRPRARAGRRDSRERRPAARP